ncbi:hypothetical protein P3X46_018810 [Hevea brasiliensis]|uniref:Uncharacterized protein n=1 Tax=Hevea brasiliensis TaxID=3981 RepID=A0ABQ9LVU9_HEVBR|nr:precursor of CEP5-like [Hevea brasiliensis]KAJ9170721.1 hypothetical protein P3X46_018810 [Hevea brasiliensis]
MAQTNLFFACVFFVLIFSQELQSIEGKRHLKLERKHKLSKLPTSNKFEREQKIFVDKHNVHGDNDSDVEVPTTFWSPPAPPVPAGEVVGMPGLSPPPPGHVDDFRPTAPGHSPGVGHSIQN